MVHVRGFSESGTRSGGIRSTRDYDIDERLVRLGKSIDTFTTAPTIVIANSTDDFVDLDFHRAKGDQLYATLNPRQKEFYLCSRWSGGAGKTYTYNVIFHMLSSMNKNVQCTAWTGIASALLSNGRTSASLFKLKIGNDSKTSNHSKGSNETKKLKEVDVIIWDECSMISKTALETADFVLRDLPDSPFSFGGKRIVLGGDFRQILPVIRRGTKTDLINNCIKNSYLWNQFQKFSLLDNMRIINADANWIKFLLDVGDGVANDYEDRVTLLEGLPVLENLVDDSFKRKCILYSFAIGSNKGKDTFVPRITCYEDKNLPFHLKRTQFPVKLAFAISINKAQGQSFGRVGLYLPEDVFAHGQTYVALSRARSKNELFIKSTSERLFNVVYKEIL
uniref:ATP-dependent DNA helicase n=2 Tax=Caenorhabditis japonica TaxID=281687 RepID=A0A8R1ICM2_CAEJA